MKPLQASVSLSAIGGDLPDRQVAVMCGSHEGEPVHVRTVRALLRRGGLTEEALRCPPDYPSDPRARAGAKRPRRITHNCSGKHAGMTVACASAGWEVETYRLRSHPLQRRVHRAVLSATGLERVDVGVDGCGVPVHGMPLRSMATLYARLARPERLGDLGGLAERCTRAMRAEPYLVAGRNQADTLVMSEVPGVVTKYGAESIACAALLEPGLGVAVKVADGGERAAGPALLRALSLLGAVSARELRALDRIARRPVWGGDGIVGHLTAEFDLRRR
jgi:L-asparaginase II